MRPGHSLRASRHEANYLRRILCLAALGMVLASCSSVAKGGADPQAGHCDSAAAPSSASSPAGVPTATVAPTRALALEEERASRSVALRFTMAVLNGREDEARSYLAPAYAARVGDLHQALGMQSAERIEWLIGDSVLSAGGAMATVEVPLRAEGPGNCPEQRVTARLRLARGGDPSGQGEWQITAIEPVR